MNAAISKMSKKWLQNIFPDTLRQPDNLNKVINLSSSWLDFPTFCLNVSIFQAVLDLISAFVRLHIGALFSGSLFAVVEARRLALTRMTEAHFIRPLHHLHFPFYKPLISLSLSLARSPSRSPRLSLKSLFSPLFHLIFSNLLRFPHLLSSRCLPPSLSLLGILQSHSQACEVKDLCNLLSPYSLSSLFPVCLLCLSFSLQWG